MKILLILVGALALLVLLGWVGLRIKPRSLPAFPQQSEERRTIPLPEGLPAPVERFYRQVYGENIPVIESLVVSGRGRAITSRQGRPSRFSDPALSYS